MSHLTAIADLNNGDILPESWVDAVRVDLNYTMVAGADLASAATLTITASFHKVTGVANIDTITDAGGQVAGQTVTLAFQGAATVRNNGGGTGNIRTRSGLSHVAQAGELMELAYDGNNWIQLTTQVMQNASGDSVMPKGIVLNGALTLAGGVALTGGGIQLDYAENTTSTFAVNGAGSTPIVYITGNAVTYDGATAVMVEVDLAGVSPAPNDSVTIYLYEGSTQVAILGTVVGQYYTAGGVDAAHQVSLGVPFRRAVKLTPSAGAHTYKVYAGKLSANGVISSGTIGSTGSSIAPSHMRIIRV